MDGQRAFPSAVALLAVTLACDTRETVPRSPESLAVAAASAPRASRRTSGRQREKTVSFLQYEQQIPGFGGFYFDRDRNLRVILTDTSRIHEARHLLAPVVRDRTRQVYGPVKPGVVARPWIMAQPGRYAFSQLDAWRDLASRTGLGDGVLGVSVAIPHNKVRVHLSEGGSAQAVLRLLTGIGIPPDALLLSEVSSR